MRTSWSSSSFAEAIDKAKASAETEKKGDAPHAQTNPAAFLPRKTEEEDNDNDNEVELRMPRYFDFEDVGGGAARAASGAGVVAGTGTVGLLDAVRMLWNLWRHMQLR